MIQMQCYDLNSSNEASFNLGLLEAKCNLKDCLLEIRIGGQNHRQWSKRQ